MDEWHNDTVSAYMHTCSSTAAIVRERYCGAGGSGDGVLSDTGSDR